MRINIKIQLQLYLKNETINTVIIFIVYHVLVICIIHIIVSSHHHIFNSKSDIAIRHTDSVAFSSPNKLFFFLGLRFLGALCS
jgi:hypothetical protein